MRSIWRHQRRVARQLASQPCLVARPWQASVSTAWNKSGTSSRVFSISCRHDDAVSISESASGATNHVQRVQLKARRLPLSCPGCGAPSQTIAAEEAGYYNMTRSGVKNYLREEVDEEDKIMDDVLKKVDQKVLSSLGIKDGNKSRKAEVQEKTPICDRCHDLIHHSGSTSTPIFHPSIESIQDMIEDSPHKENHIYHIIDAADFPMSLIPNLTASLALPRLRTQNRRSKDRRFVKGRVADVSFIITRSDLLAPKKEQVDSLMPYLRETLRDALGKTGENARLGNVRCVSSKRGWWTKTVKEDVWNRGGAGWMVGKVNVGKSGFFEVVFPKGRGSDPPSLRELRQQERKAALTTIASVGPEESQSQSSYKPMGGDSLADLPGDLDVGPKEDTTDHKKPVTLVSTETTQAEPSLAGQDSLLDEDDQDFDTISLLPPAQRETQYPVMPIISSLPGTTASPIRIPFGNGKGELIDLPGIARSSLDEYVTPEHRDDLVMKTRIVPEQHSIKPGQSLLLGGGLIRITPTKAQDLVMLAYPFVPLDPHVTATAKAEAIQNGERATGIKSILAEGVLGQESKLKSAGKFKLQWDVTKKRAGPLTSPSAVKLRPETLAFNVYSADLLIEGVGWVELVAQVRKRRRRPAPASSDSNVPPVDGNRDDSVASYKPFATDADIPDANPHSSVGNTMPPSAGVQEELHPTKLTFKPLAHPMEFEEDQIPEFEVFSPEGRFVAVRPPMNAWLLGGKQRPLSNARKSRPRLSMKSLKGSREGRRE